MRAAARPAARGAGRTRIGLDAVRREADSARFRILATCNAARRERCSGDRTDRSADRGVRPLEPVQGLGAVLRDRTEGLTLEAGGRRSNGERHRGVDRGGPVAGEGGLHDWIVGPK